MTLHQLLGIPLEEKPVVSLCGAGGKSTLLYALAREACQSVPTALLTTTHIFRPEGEDVLLSVPLDADDCRRAWREGRIAAAGRGIPAERRFGPPPEEELGWLFENAGAVYIEADGSRRLPLKYPAAWEPVIRPETTHIIVLAGLSALDKPTAETLHRPALAAEALGPLEDTVTETLMARVLWAGYRRFSPVFLLNQADTEPQRLRGEQVAEQLRALGAGRVVVTALQK